ILSIPPEFKYTFAYISAGVMLGMAAYIIFTHLIKLRIIRMVFGLLLGSVILLSVLYMRPKFIEEEDILITSLREQTLFYRKF
ncbi:MAG: hypothetical protein R6U89_01805, partial [Dehalococcoidia bacterium]